MPLCYPLHIGPATVPQKDEFRPGRLLPILGASFGIAVLVGGTIGVGILRTPGDVAAGLRDARLIIGLWIVGGVYALAGSICVCELSTMLPSAGGFYIYARRAFGDGIGLMVGGSDFLGQCSAIAYGATAAAEFLARLWPRVASFGPALPCALIASFGLLQSRGLRISSHAQEWTSAVKACALLAFVAAAFAYGSRNAAPVPLTFEQAPWFVAFASVILTYDGWYCPIYFVEENRAPGRNLPRSIIGGILVVIVIYLLVNFAYLSSLGTAGLAASRLPASDSVRGFAGSAAGSAVTVLVILSIAPLIHAVLLCSTRILFGMSRDGLLPPLASTVNAGGTPSRALWIAAGTSILLAATGTFRTLVEIASVLFVVNHCAAYLSLLILRRREPQTSRPFRAWLYPFTPLAALAGGGAFLAAAAIGDTTHFLIALSLVAAGYPLSLALKRSSSR